MKRILLACVCLASVPAVAAACGVQCAQSQFIQTVYPTTIGVPVAESYGLGYTFAPQPNITVNVQLDSQGIATKVSNDIINALNAPEPTVPVQPPPIGPPPAPPAPQPAPQVAKAIAPSGSLFAEQSCTRCHGGANAKATAAVDMRLPLTCPQKLAAINAIVAGRMPLNAPLTDPNEAAKLITELTK